MDKEPVIWAVIPAAGKGERFGYRKDKLMAPLAKIPVIVRSVEGILDADEITGAVVVVHPEREVMYKRTLKQYGHRKPVKFVQGGSNRQDSVCNGVKAVPEEADFILVHDAARPLVSEALIHRLTESLNEQPEWAGCIPGTPVTDTVKRIQGHTLPGMVAETVDRSTLWQVQTPQIFRKEVLLNAYDKVNQDSRFTDEAQLIETTHTGNLGMVEGDSANIKITHPLDLDVAELLYKKANRKRSAKAGSI